MAYIGMLAATTEVWNRGLDVLYCGTIDITCRLERCKESFFDDSRCSRELRFSVEQNSYYCCTSVI